MSKQNDVSERKAYREPQLVEFGPLVELTRGGGNTPNTEDVIMVGDVTTCMGGAQATWMSCML